MILDTNLYKNMVRSREMIKRRDMLSNKNFRGMLGVEGKVLSRMLGVEGKVLRENRRLSSHGTE